MNKVYSIEVSTKKPKKGKLYYYFDNFANETGFKKVDVCLFELDIFSVT